MKRDLISELSAKFEGACYNLDGLECWSGRELQEILGYSDWRNFTNTIQKAVKACENAGAKESDLFVGVTKMIEIGKGDNKEFKMLHLQDMLVTWWRKMEMRQNLKLHAQTYFVSSAVTSSNHESPDSPHNFTCRSKFDLFSEVNR